VREVAQAGAVLGREFAHDLLAAVADVPEPRLRAALSRLEAAGLLHRRGEPPGAVYAFKHALVQDAAHGTLLRERRRALHARAAEAIGRLRPEVAEREPEVLALHRAEAGEAQAAAVLYLRAAERASARSAMREARAHVAHGLGLLRGVPEGEAGRRLEAELQIALGDVAIADAGLGSAETGRAFGRAVEICRALEEGALLARALWGLWSYRLHAGDLAGALPLAEEAVELARRQDAADQRWRSLAALGTTRYYRGQSDLARPALEAATVGPGAYGAGTGGVSGGSVAQSMLARLLAGLGALDQSVGHASETIERARRAGHLPSLANALVVGCAQACLVRDIGSLRGRVRALAELTEAQGFAFWAVRARCFAGWVAVEEGQVAEGIGLVLGGLAALREAGIALHTPHMEAMLADAHLLGGDVNAALIHVEEALRISARTGEVWFDAELHRHLGGVLLCLHPGDPARAEDEFRRAIGIARSQSARLFELRAARDLARLLRDQGRIAKAHELLALVYAAFTEGFGFPDLVEARALLEELGGAPMDGAPDVAAGPPSAR
jgi:predicted ATPase